MGLSFFVPVLIALALVALAGIAALGLARAGAAGPAPRLPGAEAWGRVLCPLAGAPALVRLGMLATIEGARLTVLECERFDAGAVECERGCLASRALHHQLNERSSASLH